MQDTPLDTINDIFREHGKACPVIAYEIDCHHIGRPRREMIYRQLKHTFGKKYQITFTPNRFRIIQRPSNRAVA